MPMIALFQNIVLVLVALLIGLLIGALLLKILRVTLRRAGMAKIFVNFISTALGSLLLLVVFILALDAVDLDTETLWIFLGAIIVTLALALQESLQNVAAGIRLAIDQPFRENDRIEVGQVIGYVEEIRLLNTVIRTRDNVQVMLPNTLIFRGPIFNFTIRERRRVDLIIRLSYDNDIRQAREVLLTVMHADSRVLAEPAPTVTVAELAPEAIHLNVRPWVKSDVYWEARWDLHEKIKVAFDEHGLTLPLPQLEVRRTGDNNSTRIEKNC
ncbi:MAG: mechanosensitive ion channel family protein [Anaerolineae bacterium]|nr:mechanosensitive ion channel family protein [Anaerolineae bacterium]